MSMTNFDATSTAEQVTEGQDLKGKRWLITGVNSGLGYESARVLALRGAEIVGAARTREKAADALARLGIQGEPVACELSDPGSDAWWGREAYESLVLRTWRNLLGPDRVLEKARAVCEGAFDLSVSPKRSLAVEALPFFLGAGEIDAALRCLEIAACKLEAPANLPYPWYREQFERFGRAPALVDLFPTDLASRPGAAEWCAGIERSVLEWLDAQRIEDGAAFRLLAFCTLRQHELGLLDDRDGRLALLRGLTAGSSTLELWLVDLLRALGDGPGADAIERTLLASGRLHLGRIAEVLARIVAAEGGAAALELGESVAAYVLEDELLAVLIGAAESAESEERAQHWREVRTRASEARVELQERDEEARRSSAASRR